MRYALLIAVSAFSKFISASSAHFPELFASSSPACALQSPWLPEYHLDSTCDRSHLNSREQRVRRYQELLHLSKQHRHHQQKSDEIVILAATTTLEATPTEDAPDQTPMETTISCPQGGLQDLRYTSNGKDSVSLGLPTKWIVENTSSTAVVVAMVSIAASLDPQQMVSAANPSMAPPQQDPNSILQPNEWRSFDVLEGQVFHVYQLLDVHSDQNMELQPQLGNLLLQHRAGLISIQRQPRKDDPVHQFCTSQPSSSMPSTTATIQNDRPRFPFTMNQQERCNSLYRGFRNDVGCDVDVYYIRSKGGGQPCHEVKKFHLGTDRNAGESQDNVIQYQATLVDSTFVVRLSQHPEIVVNTITIQPTRVVDCLNKRRLVDDQPSQSTLEKVAETIMNPATKNQTTAHLEHRWLTLLALPPANATQQPAQNFVSSS